MAQQTENQVGTYHFLVDGKPYESKERTITGERLRAITGIRPQLRIFLADHPPGESDQLVAKDTIIDLDKIREAQFYTLSPPSYDIF